MEALVEARLASEEPVWVGQKATMIVELKVPGFFSGTPAFDLPEVPGVILIPPRDRPLLDSETIDSTSYTVQRHELGVFVRRSGEQVVPGIPVRLGYKRSPLDREVIKATVTSEPIALSVKTPAGAEGLGNIISARDLTATESWSSETNRFKVGDALARTVRFVASDLPAIAFPEFPKSEVEGVSIYRDEPELSETNERGESQSERTERLTYVCAEVGEFIIPEVSFTWFDLDLEELRTVRFDERRLSVVPNPKLAIAVQEGLAEPVEGSRGYGRLLTWFGTILVLGLAVIKLGGIRGVVGGMKWFRPRHLVPLKPASSDSSTDRRSR